MSPRNSPEELPKPLAGNMLNKVFFPRLSAAAKGTLVLIAF